jgi:Domain of unknown function (DUF4365)
MRKQSKAQIIGREGERWFSSILPPEWSLQRPIDDFGSDGIVAVGSEKHLTSFEFGVQVKSTSQLKAVKGSRLAPPYVDRWHRIPSGTGGRKGMI